jgi:hypothetical protein
VGVGQLGQFFLKEMAAEMRPHAASTAGLAARTPLPSAQHIIGDPFQQANDVAGKYSP